MPLLVFRILAKSLGLREKEAGRGEIHFHPTSVPFGDYSRRGDHNRLSRSGLLLLGMVRHSGALRQHCVESPQKNRVEFG